ncbi:MAG: hypothetical protein QOK10_3234 [Pseudonocardiales bacterium]|jgi:hypothetical protein|nr:hypothetical protein [Pseudonocardiales bacterium]
MIGLVSRDLRLRRMLFRFLAVVLATLTVALVLPTHVAIAETVPYTDPAVSGAVGLCNKAGQPITGGSINDRPFVWRAVSSSQAPPSYQGTGRKASLLIYQPRPNVSADKWSGDQMTATSDYTNVHYPMSQATDADFTLAEYLNEFKPMVDGLLQLRLYFGIPGQSTWTQSYPATDIQVTGTTWHVVHGANLPCTQGTSHSSELDTLGSPGSAPPAAQSGTTTAPKPGSTPGRSHSASASSTAARTGRSSSAIATPAGTSASSEASAVAQSRSGGVNPLYALLGLLAIAAVVVGYWWRRRPAR